jgi:hypothetical protein
VGQRCAESGRHLITAEIAPSEEERGDARGEEGLSLDRVSPNPIVLAQDHSALGADVSEPDLVGGILRKVIVMDFDAHAQRPQRVGQDLSAERPIDEEDSGFRQPPGSRS